MRKEEVFKANNDSRKNVEEHCFFFFAQMSEHLSSVLLSEGVRCAQGEEVKRAKAPRTLLLLLPLFSWCNRVGSLHEG